MVFPLSRERYRHSSRGVRNEDIADQHRNVKLLLAATTPESSTRTQTLVSGWWADHPTNSFLRRGLVKATMTPGSPRLSGTRTDVGSRASGGIEESEPVAMLGRRTLTVEARTWHWVWDS
jgi:hypothetical protein